MPKYPVGYLNAPAHLPGFAYCMAHKNWHFWVNPRQAHSEVLYTLSGNRYTMERTSLVTRASTRVVLCYRYLSEIHNDNR